MREGGISFLQKKNVEKVVHFFYNPILTVYDYFCSRGFQIRQNNEKNKHFDENFIQFQQYRSNDCENEAARV